jgi:hypothetical protein
LIDLQPSGSDGGRVAGAAAAACATLDDSLAALTKRAQGGDGAATPPPATANGSSGRGGRGAVEAGRGWLAGRAERELSLAELDLLLKDYKRLARVGWGLLLR